MRATRKQAKPGELCAFYGKLPHDQPDVIYAWGEGCSKRDSALLFSVFGSKRPDWQGQLQDSLLDDLKARGYDLSTIKFSIRKVKP
jgi:hypothetical protein